MNQNSLKAAVKKYGTIENESELIEALKSDEKQFSESEITEIVAAIKSPTKEQSYLETYNFSDLEAVEVFDENEGEKDLKQSEGFKKYNEEFAKLLHNKQYDFYKFNAVGQFRKNKKGKNVLVGIKIINKEPKAKTRLEVRFVNNLNMQIHNTDNRKEASIYYLIAK